MATNPKLAAAAKTLFEDGGLDACFDACNNGFVDIYSGAQPTNPDTALGAQVKLAHLPCSATAFAAAAAGSKVANPISTAAALVSGTAAWFSLTKSNGTRWYEDTVGTSGAAINLNTTTITANTPVSCTGLTVSATVT